MSARRTSLAFALALFISGILTWSITRSHRGTTPVITLPVHHILVAARDVSAGEKLAAGSVKEVDWAATETLPGAATDLSNAVGRVALLPLVSGQPILLPALADAGSNEGISATIPRGMRAVTVRGPDVVTASGFLQPGDLVDVLATYHSESSASIEAPAILQAIRVFAVGDRTSPLGVTSPTVANSVTLLIPASEIAAFNSAMAGGRITFALRNGIDTTRDAYTHEAVGSKQQVTDIPAVAAVGTRRRDRHIFKLDSFTVEIIAGEKHTSQTFEEDRP